MVKFINRNDVLSWIKSHTSRRGVVRSIEEGRVELKDSYIELITMFIKDRINKPVELIRVDNFDANSMNTKNIKI